MGKRLELLKEAVPGVTHVAYLSGFNTRSALGAFTARMAVGVAVFFPMSGFLLYRPFVARRRGVRERQIVAGVDVVRQLAGVRHLDRRLARWHAIITGGK